MSYLFCDFEDMDEDRIEKEYEYELYETIKLEGMGAAPARQRRLFED